MENLNEMEKSNNFDMYESESSDFVPNAQENLSRKDVLEDSDNLNIVQTPVEEPDIFRPKFRKIESSGVRVGAFSEALEALKNYQEPEERLSDKQSIDVEVDSVSETLSDKVEQLDSLLKSENTVDLTVNSSERKESAAEHIKKLISVPDNFTDSSQSSGSEPQSAAPFESSSSSQENNTNANQVNFENALGSEMMWKENDSLPAPINVETKPEIEPEVLPVVPTEGSTFPPNDITEIKTEENTQPITTAEVLPPDNAANGCFLPPPFPLPPPPDPLSLTEGQNEIKLEPTFQPPSAEVMPLPVVPPAPRKRGRPRKQVLPNPSPLVESWGPNAQEFPSLEPAKEEVKRSSRSERRQSKKKKLDDENGDESVAKKRKAPPTYQKKKRRSTYVPKKKLQTPKKKHSEIENIQNFEEETRMSASEGHTGFPSKSGATGDESQGSSATDGPTRSNINKKGRMEVGTDGCKPVTVQQIVEYHWPPPSNGEKTEALMIQEQITEYLGVKSFKRKYPNIKRRAVDMEERNYLQENGFVSENMCDMGLTAVFAADIIEIMYNDFPHKFDEYRKYTREKKAKEQRALREKQAAERADMDPKKEAIESTLSWNTDFNKTRREKRASCFDLQTFTVHFPTNRFKRISLGKPGHYPVALIPGQNTDYYKRYTSNELKYFPLNTVLYGPLRPNERHLPIPSGSDGSQSEIDDSSSSDESSSSSSEETQDTEETSSTIEEEAGDVKSEKTTEAEERESSRGTKSSTKTPKGRGRGKASNLEKSEPKKRLGRPPKLKLASIKLKRVDNEIMEALKEEKLDISSRIIIHTCKMCHEEESKNKNGEFESFIECAQCKGKIHPSCIDLTADMIPKISSYGWQCTDCKSCVKCGQSSSEDKMIFCDQCDRGYHIFCVGLSEVPSGNYICMECKPNTTPEEPPKALENGSEKTEVKEEESVEVKEEVKMEEESGADKTRSRSQDSYFR